MASKIQVLLRNGGGRFGGVFVKNNVIIIME
jgi:hypothetical protein